MISYVVAGCFRLKNINRRSIFSRKMIKRKTFMQKFKNRKRAIKGLKSETDKHSTCCEVVYAITTKNCPWITARKVLFVSPDWARYLFCLKYGITSRYHLNQWSFLSTFNESKLSLFCFPALSHLFYELARHSLPIQLFLPGLHIPGTCNLVWILSVFGWIGIHNS